MATSSDNDDSSSSEDADSVFYDANESLNTSEAAARLMSDRENSIGFIFVFIVHLTITLDGDCHRKMNHQNDRYVKNVFHSLIIILVYLIRNKFIQFH